MFVGAIGQNIERHSTPRRVDRAPRRTRPRSLIRGSEFLYVRSGGAMGSSHSVMQGLETRAAMILPFDRMIVRGGRAICLPAEMSGQPRRSEVIIRRVDRAA
jgi:hypothetical protein